MLRARRLSPRVIAIVDGVFARTAAIWHKEILLALDDGISVFGASSMGALRAAELVPFGMVGIGRIFEAYRDGLYTDDDEVALLHGPIDSGYREMSQAMVNIRATVAHAVSSGVIHPDSGERVIGCAKATFYQVRSLDAAIEATWRSDPHAEEASRFRRFIASGGYVNQKRLDALELLTYVRDRTTQSAAVHAVHRTSFILKLHYETTCRPFDAPESDLPPDEHVAFEAGALGRVYPPLCRLAQMMSLVHALGDDAVADFARRHGRRATRRLHRRHMLDLIRLDGAYRRLLPACGLGARPGCAERRTATASRSPLPPARHALGDRQKDRPRPRRFRRVAADALRRVSPRPRAGAARPPPWRGITPTVSTAAATSGSWSSTPVLRW